MDAEVSRGRWQLIGLAAGVYGPPINGALLGFSPRSLVAALFPAVCLVGLVRGWGLAYTWTVISLTLGVMAALAGVVFAPTTVLPTALRITLALAAVSWASALVALTRSEGIASYLEHRQEST